MEDVQLGGDKKKLRQTEDRKSGVMEEGHRKSSFSGVGDDGRKSRASGVGRKSQVGDGRKSAVGEK